MHPLFYTPDIPKAGGVLDLPEETARHLVQVLRKEVGFELLLTDGHGTKASGVLAETGKKRASVQIQQIERIPEPQPRLTLAVAFTKAAARNEWLLEKVTELGVSRIVPLLVQRSETEKFRKERWEAILVSAMQQSQQYWLPQLEAPQKLQSFLQQPFNGQLLMAHCMDSGPRQSFRDVLQPGTNACLLIGPEGDFTEAEVLAALGAGARPVTLGLNRLRTETAAMTGAAYFRLLNDA
ncbi:MAG: 16S rRNA (uracil(1498)-N(3))-methyltransferase [Sphingobacteriales bacterium]|nr:MAG: 16S rRNA (uracil(1498)-N(3))-methyltransferase [Sphingobacteriales bacterium]